MGLRPLLISQVFWAIHTVLVHHHQPGRRQLVATGHSRWTEANTDTENHQRILWDDHPWTLLQSKQGGKAEYLTAKENWVPDSAPSLN